ncbi:MAG: ArsC family reductase [Hyphomicrobiaceae bacterium]
MRHIPAVDENNGMKLYGIPNCTTVKKARAWLAGHALDVAFHDFKKQGVDAAWLHQVVAQIGWQPLLNTRGTTWRKLSDAEKAAASDEAGAIALMRAQPSVIKRPLLERDGRYHLGFAEDQYEALFGA